MPSAAEIKRACAKTLANKYFEPSFEATHCNEALHSILTDLGYPKICTTESGTILMANGIIDRLENGGYTKVSFFDAFDLANQGVIVVAGLRMPVHGHVAVIYPSPGRYTSGKWQRWDVPFCANVGAVNGVVPLNYAFGAVPGLWRISE